MSRETFEQWLASKEAPATGIQTGKMNEYRTHMCKEVWQACEQYYQSRIAELEAKLAEAEKRALKNLQWIADHTNDTQIYNFCRQALKSGETK